MTLHNVVSSRQDATVHLCDADLMELDPLREATVVSRADASLRGSKRDPTMLLDEGDLLGLEEWTSRDDATRVERPSRRPSGLSFPGPLLPAQAPFLPFTVSGRFLAAVEAASRARVVLLEPERVAPARLAICSFAAGVVMTLLGVAIAL